MERPLRLITSSPVEELARTIEALLVVASQPLSAEDLAAAADDDVERVEEALRAARRAASPRAAAGSSSSTSPGATPSAPRARRPRPALACSSGRSSAGSRRRRSRRSPSSPISGRARRPDVARIRGVAADSVVAGLVERGLVAESGRDEGGAVRYRMTPLFERVFGLESLSELPRLDDLGGSAEEISGTPGGGRGAPAAPSQTLLASVTLR